MDSTCYIHYLGNRVLYVHWVDDMFKLHREDGPAVEWDNGEKRYYQHGKLHREDGPAIIMPDGFRAWYQHGLHWSIQDGKNILRETSNVTHKFI